MKATGCLIAIVGAFLAVAAESAGDLLFTNVYTAGVTDDFAAPIEIAVPSVNAAIVYTINRETMAADFDETFINKFVIHTFAGLPAGIVSATLELRVKGGTDPLINNDIIGLGFAESPAETRDEAFAWGRHLGPVGTIPGGVFPTPDPGIIQSTPWSTGDVADIVLDLSALPLADGGTVDVIGTMRVKGFIDAVVWDDTYVDHMKLTIVVPEPTTVVLLVLGGLGLATARRRH